MAPVHTPWPEPWVHVSCLGSDDQAHSGSLHRSVVAVDRAPRRNYQAHRVCSLDTMGYAFTFPVVSVLGGIPVGAYVHYPTISTDMLARVKSRKSWHTNSDWISSSVILSQAKLLCVP